MSAKNAKPIRKLPAVTVKRADLETDGVGYVVRASRDLFLSFAESIADERKKKALARLAKTAEAETGDRIPLVMQPEMVADLFTFAAQPAQ